MSRKPSPSVMDTGLRLFNEPALSVTARSHAAASAKADDEAVQSRFLAWIAALPLVARNDGKSGRATQETPQLNVKRYDILFSFFAGALGAVSMAPFRVVEALFISLSIAALLFINAQTPRAAFKRAYAFGLGYYLAGLWWISNALLVDFEHLYWMWPLALLGLPAFLGLFPAIALSTVKRIAYGAAPATQWIGFVVGMMAVEYARATVLTGLPWNLYGMAWMSDRNLPVAQIASITGIHGLTALTILVCALPALCVHYKRGLYAFGAALLCLAGAMVWGQMRMHAPVQNTDTTVYLVQASIPQQDKWDPRKEIANIQKAIGMTRDALAKTPAARSLVVWPETAVSQYMLDARPDIARDLAALPRIRDGVSLISGYFYNKGSEEKPAYQNALALWNAASPAPQPFYAKHHLVPFGEYVPFDDILHVGTVVGFDGFAAGTGAATIHLPDLPAMRPQICYEIIFPQYARATDSDFILTVANDAWYGDAPGPYQHLDMARMRAIESGVPVVRAANTGISAVIDPYGRINAHIAYNATEFLATPLPARLSSIGIYPRLGDTLFYIYFSIILLIFGLKIRFFR